MTRKSNDSEGFPPGFIFTCGHLASVGRFFSWKRFSSWFFWSKAIILLTASLSFSSCSKVWREKNIILQTKEQWLVIIIQCHYHLTHIHLNHLKFKPIVSDVFYLSVVIAVSLKRGKKQVLPTHQLN